ncbi:efflux RND transporter periplasmic adaptor subunit [Paucibacter sp. R3-3]|uniref:Efflux RND transporter periplasmic adaptor subunit n=1 Tax=Roseateles agri TaxID=3098619 RepID=A0ABU5DRP2_9BURK|nr:efflux RND transporter periplasmic adaptor subunit [Paucibacter sp. R3-3]MDY0748988.1 efflux RND transporter periplasmic adaptor subunit [Paucibacter sp. R3-3]
MVQEEKIRVTAWPIRTALAGALIAALCACSKAPAPVARGPVEVGVVTLATQRVELPTDLPGRTTASEVSDVRPQVTGILKARKFEEGSLVKAGQLLYEIDPASYQATADQAKAALANAQATLASAELKDKRYAELATVQGVAKQDADDAHAAYLQALASVAQQKAAYETARINLDYTRVRAPISGRIGISGVTSGALVTSGQTTALATIRALDPIYVDLTQSSAQLLQLRRSLAQGDLHAGSASVSLKLEDGTAYPLKGQLKFAEVAVDESTGSVTLRAQFPNPKGVLLPGMYVRAQLDQAVDPAAILAPQQGISRDAKGNATASVVNAENKVEQRAPTATRAIGDQWLITAGLKSGDRLIVQGLSKIRPGDTVKVVDVAASTPAAAVAEAGR